MPRVAALMPGCCFLETATPKRPTAGGPAPDPDRLLPCGLARRACVLQSRMERHLIEEPGGRARARAKETETAAPLIPPRPTISKLQEAARGCRLSRAMPAADGIAG